MQKVIRTKMADALIRATHESINAGNNTGRLGRLVLTAEAAGIGSRPLPRPKQVPRLMQKQAGTILAEVLFVFVLTGIAAAVGTFGAEWIINTVGVH